MAGYAVCEYGLCAMPFTYGRYKQRYCCPEHQQANKRLTAGHRRKAGAEARGTPQSFWLYDDGIVDDIAVDLVVHFGKTVRMTRAEALIATRKLIRKGMPRESISTLLGDPTHAAMQELYQTARAELEAEGFQWQQTSKYSNVSF